jgi:hypothetical protein
MKHCLHPAISVLINNTMKRAKKILFLLLLIAAMIGTTVSDAISGVKVTVTFAAGGAACGAFFFFIFTSGGSKSWHNTDTDARAILNYSPEGWQMRFPTLMYANDRDVGVIPYTEIIRIRF